VCTVPGHDLVLHNFESFGTPLHCRPPFKGTGLVHFLERLWLPAPHVAEHGAQPDHILQPPFTCESVIFDK